MPEAALTVSSLFTAKIVPDVTLKAELKRRGVSYRDLAEKLTAMGVPGSERNIVNRSHEVVSSQRFLQRLVAVGVTSLRVDE